MNHRQHSITGIAVLLAAVLIVSSGCANTNNGNTPIRQQGTHMQQATNPSPANVDNRIQIANQAAEKIIKLDGVSKANVLVSRQNAYVAAALHTNQGQLNRTMEDQIAQQVRATDPNIQNVYVSTNPEFVDRVNTYVTDVKQGRPVAGFFEGFSEMIQRVFPTAR
jgi:YhcN/YlaJ family sporulation lipoprotein